MSKNYLWFKISIFLQFLTGGLHLVSFGNPLVVTNDKEKLLFDLMENYTFNMKLGFAPSMGDFMTSYSITFSIFLFFSGIMNVFLLRSNLPHKTIKGIILINLCTYMVFFTTVFILTFLPPIFFVGCILGALIIAYVRAREI